LESFRLPKPFKLGDEEIAELPWTMKLVMPIKEGSADIAELVLRCPTIGENEEALKKHGSTTAANIMLIATITGITETAIRRLSGGDYLRASDFFEAVTASIRGTGNS
jgi:hypothetical protein